MAMAMGFAVRAVLAGSLTAALTVGCSGPKAGAGADVPTPVARTADPCGLLTDDAVATAMQGGTSSRPAVSHQMNGDSTCLWEEGSGIVSVKVTRDSAENNQRFLQNNIATSPGMETVPAKPPAQVFYQTGNGKGTVWFGGEYLAQLQRLPVGGPADDEINRRLLLLIGDRLAG